LLSTIPGLLKKDPVDSASKLVDLVRDQQILLILDNLESGLSPGSRDGTRSFLNQLLSGTKRLTILATTRELVGGLELGEAQLELERMDDESAVSLLANRAPDSRRVLIEVELNHSTGELISRRRATAPSR
jgi:predicted ATPase